MQRLHSPDTLGGPGPHSTAPYFHALGNLKNRVMTFKALGPVSMAVANRKQEESTYLPGPGQGC